MSISKEINEEIIDIAAVELAYKNWESTNVALNSKSARQKAMASFSKMGFPIGKNESWKYTNLSPILKKGFAPIGAYSPGNLAASSYQALKISNGKAIRLVFVDGFFNAELSDLYEVKGLHFNTLAHSEIENYNVLPSESMVALNTAFTKDGAVIKIDNQALIEEPIELYNITTCPGIKMIQPRHHIEIGDAAEVTFVESYHNLCVGSSFTNTVNTIKVGKNANVHYIKVEHPKRPNTFIIDHTMVEQAAQSTFNMFTITLSGDLVRNHLHITINGEHANTILMGLYLLGKKEHVDNKTTVDHAVPNCYSNELYKGILGGTSTGVFNGKIIVREDAQKTNAYQNNRNILVSDDATINSQPQLEIFADDVKCSHGATSAQIDDSELFYLRARGIGKEKARGLLMFAFAEEILEKIKNESVRQFLEEEVAHALGIEN
jgi:Fe-S cluster assembly protein SufD